MNEISQGSCCVLQVGLAIENVRDCRKTVWTAIPLMVLLTANSGIPCKPRSRRWISGKGVQQPRNIVPMGASPSPVKSARRSAR